MTACNPQAPGGDCPRCPRLVAYRLALRGDFPEWANAPVPSFGPLGARLLVVGLAPGVRGANRTGRPFTGDYAGDLLYATLTDLGLMTGVFDRRADDGLTPIDVRITNAVRCVPPENKPTGPEQVACRPFLAAEIAAMPALRGILALGRVAHEAVLRTLGQPLKAHPFAHGALHPMPGGLLLGESYHCSRYNQNTGRLTDPMFREAVTRLVEAIS
ncbi:uracil-DNA glycosylase [Rhodospirillum rubrum]|uniref:uracil-DNA glycosylase n=1 Tax=Rhodospirillum rubrum TaxID=1085 RepID=UPI001903A72C|nr:uracil-DNA glycosylase [Rhodospirillum rubrum]MBK1664179.1 uracil-DNA glycosylase [Rhodospirillum rubrum]MBK1675800.1 uracil-DNA glycosylase [Rhodospirillum rubrum]